MFNRKFRWLFEGKDKDGNVVFPFSFVKVSGRPDCPYGVADENSSGLVLMPGEIGMTVWPDASSLGTFSFLLMEMTNGILRLVDGCGSDVEKWTFDDINLKAIQFDYECIDFTIKYKTCQWDNCTLKCLEEKDSNEVSGVDYVIDVTDG